jgi:hypothetical protein
VGQRTLDRAVAQATGEPLSTIRRLGFGPDAAAPGEDGDDLALAIDCPCCGRPAAYPGRGRRGEPLLAECGRCDAYFGFDEADVYVAYAATLDAA